MMMRSIDNTDAVRIEDADLCLSKLTENSLMISKTQEITKFNTRALTNPKNGGIYSNGLSTMTVSELSESSDLVGDGSSSWLGPLVSSCALALPQVDVGLLASFPDSWSGWECKRREEAINHHDKYFKKTHSKQLRNLKRIRRKTVETKKKPSAIVRRRRLRLDRSIVRKGGCVQCPAKDENNSEMVPFQSSKSLRRRQRRRVVRFVDEEITEWTRENGKAGFGRGKRVGKEVPFREAERERKENQRALMDLQVGMKCMGL